MTSFEELPARIFLDSSVLQTIHGYGEIVFENEDLPASDKMWTISGGPEELEALRAIFFVNQRAMFEFALSEHSFAEVEASGDRRYLRWAYDVLDHWHACLEGYDGSPFSGDGIVRAERLDSSRFGYLSEKDRLLLRDAVSLECDAFLTMERRLPNNAPHLKRELELIVLRPTSFWLMLRPWARLFV